jgi:hypothetical protein
MGHIVLQRDPTVKNRDVSPELMSDRHRYISMARP